jgi:drug/metabolite transporter (DMT)-like permease
LFLASLIPRFPDPVQVSAYRASIKTLLALGAAVSVTVVAYTYAVQHTTAANAVLLVNTAPLYVAVLSPVLLKEPRPAYTWISLGMALSGMVLIADPGQLDVQSDEMGGVAAAALSGMTYGAVMLISRSLRGKVTGLTQNLWSVGFILLILLPWAAQSSLDTVIANLHLLIPLGVLSLGLSYLFYFLGLARISAQVVSVVSLAEPVFGILMGVIFFAEVPNEYGWIGGVLILASIYLIARPVQVARRQRI